MGPFELIRVWRTSFSLPVRTELTVPSEAELKLATNLIQEEFDELKQAILEDLTNGKFNSTADAIGDLYFVVSQMACIVGLDPCKLIETVYKSNMSKICFSEIEADKSIQAYKKKGIDAFYEKIGNSKYIIRDLNTNKVLKGIGFQEPEWEYDNEINKENGS